MAELRAVFTIAGLVCALAGMLMLVHPPAKYGVHPPPASGAKTPSARAVRAMGLYILLVGTGAFLEKSILGGMDATQLNALVSVAMTAVAGVTLAGMGPPCQGPTLRWRASVSAQ